MSTRNQMSFSFAYCYGDYRELHSFPTRRSSDLLAPADESTELPEWVTSCGRAAAIRYNGSVARLTIGPVTNARVSKWLDRKSTRLNSSHSSSSYAVFCLKKKNRPRTNSRPTPSS